LAFELELRTSALEGGDWPDDDDGDGAPDDDDDDGARGSGTPTPKKSIVRRFHDFFDENAPCWSAALATLSGTKGSWLNFGKTLVKFWENAGKKTETRSVEGSHA
jgi:hypothetical protein